MAGVGYMSVCVLVVMFTHGHGIKVGVIVEDRISSDISRDISVIIEKYFNMTDLQTTEQFTNHTVELVWRYLKVTNGIFASQAVCDLVQHGVHSLITVLPCRSLKYVASQVDMFNLPHLALSSDSCDTDTTSLYTLHMTPSHSLQTRLITDIISLSNWPAIGLIFDSSLHSVLRNELIRSFTDMEIETTLIPVTSNPDSLSKLQRSRSKTFIVWTEPNTIVPVFNMAKTLSMTTSEYSYMVFSDDISTLTMNKVFRSFPSSNTLLVRRHRNSMDNCQSETSCQEFTIFHLTLADAVLYYQALPLDKAADAPIPSAEFRCFYRESSPLTWGAELMTKLRQVTLTGLTGIRGFDHTGFPEIINYGLYGIKYDSDDETISSIGMWGNKNGLALPGGKLFANKFQTFANKRIYITAREERPFVIKERIGNETIYTGFAFDILNELSNRLYFSYSVIEPGDPRYGVEEKNGTWNGMIGKVMLEDIAMAVGPFAITSTRETKVDFTTPFWEDSFGILTLKSESESGKLFQMMKPFTTDVWVSIAGAMVIVALVSFLSSYFSPYTEWRRDSTNVSKKEASLKENFWIIYSSVIEQGPSFHPSGISSRCILGFWWLFTILIVSTYTANLAAFLTVVDASSSINNLEELLEQREIGILIQDGGNIMTMFKKSNNKLYRQVWERIQQSPSVVSKEEALDYVKTGKYAYIDMKSILDHTAAESCGVFAVSKETFNSGTFGFVVPENAPYLDVASYNIMKMLEGGLVDNWQQRWWPKVYNCSAEQNARTGSATSLRLDSLGGLFIVYCVITVAGFLSLLLEIMIRRLNPEPPPTFT